MAVELDVAISALNGSLVHSVSSSFTSTAAVESFATREIAGTAYLVVVVPASTTVRIEFLRSSVYVRYPTGTDWPEGTVDLVLPYDAVTPIEGVRLTRITGSGTVSYTLSDGNIAWSTLQEDMRGIVQCKTLVVDGITGIKSVDPITDRGFCSQYFGIDTGMMMIENEATSGYSWDATRGNPIFYAERCANGTLDIIPPTNNTDLGSVANQAARLALSSAVVNNACYQIDTALYYVLTTAGPSTDGHWTALPAGTAYGIVTIQNPTGRSLVTDGPMVGYKRRGVNFWTAQ
jgi:hypothetical protein